MPIPPVTAQVPVAPTPLPVVEPVTQTETDNKSAEQDEQSGDNSRSQGDAIISTAGREAQVRDTLDEDDDAGTEDDAEDDAEDESGDGAQAARSLAGETQLNEEDSRVVEQLASRDREVRAHEQAHKSAAGSYAKGGASFTYETGPDGQRYAVGGEVSIDTSQPSDPQEALSKAETIRRAALAPAQPSGQDRSVAAQASNNAQQARTDIQIEAVEQSTQATSSTAAEPEASAAAGGGTDQLSAEDRDNESQERDLLRGARETAARAYDSNTDPVQRALEVSA